MTRIDINFPFHVDANARTAVAGRDDHIRQMIEQVLFTAPGERVNRPDFGSGLLQLVFTPNSPELATAVQFSVAAQLERWLGDVITVEGLNVEASEGTLRIVVQYVVILSRERQVGVFTLPGVG